MAIDDIQTLYEQCQHVFDPRELPPDWEDWRMIPINTPESTELEPIERDLFALERDQDKSGLNTYDDPVRRRHPNVPDFREHFNAPHFAYPGIARRVDHLSPSSYSPDALAFYLLKIDTL